MFEAAIVVGSVVGANAAGVALVRSAFGVLNVAQVAMSVLIGAAFVSAGHFNMLGRMLRGFCSSCEFGFSVALTGALLTAMLVTVLALLLLAFIGNRLGSMIAFAVVSAPFGVTAIVSLTSTAEQRFGLETVGAFPSVGVAGWTPVICATAVLGAFVASKFGARGLEMSLATTAPNKLQALGTSVVVTRLFACLGGALCAAAAGISQASSAGFGLSGSVDMRAIALVSVAALVGASQFKTASSQTLGAASAGFVAGVLSFLVVVRFGFVAGDLFVVVLAVAYSLFLRPADARRGDARRVDNNHARVEKFLSAVINNYVEVLRHRVLIVGALLAVAAPFVLETDRLSAVAIALGLGIVVVSQQIAWGWMRQPSVGQLGFAAFGAWTFAHIGSLGGLSVGLPVGLLLGVVGGAAVAAVVGLVARRREVTFVITLTCTALASVVLFRSTSPDVPSLGGVGGYAVALIGFALVGFGTLVIRRTRLGIALRVLGDDDSLTASFGVSPFLLRVAGFSVSGAVAGLGGGVIVAAAGTLSATNFSAAAATELAVIALAGGVSSLGGAAVVVAVLALASAFGLGTTQIAAALAVIVIVSGKNNVQTLISSARDVLIRRRAIRLGVEVGELDVHPGSERKQIAPSKDAFVAQWTLEGQWAATPKDSQ